MAKTSHPSQTKNSKLEQAVKAAAERVKKMTKEEHVAQFKKIGVLTNEGELAPEFEGLRPLMTKSQ